jgi:ribosomal protein S25
LGGAKKKSISQMARQQQLKDEASKKEKKEEKKDRKSTRSVNEVYDENEVTKAIKELKAVTPHALAGQLNVRVGVAKRILKSMDEKGLARLVSGSSRIRVYSSS